MSFTIQIGDVTNFVADLQNLSTKTKEYIVNRMSEIVYDKTADGAAKHKRTGTLEQSVYNREIPGGRAIGHDGEYIKRRYKGDGEPRDYSYDVLFGWARNKPIYPKTRADGTKKKALRWVSGSSYVFAAYVETPASYPGDNYLYKAADEAVKQFRDIVDEAIRKNL